MPTIIPLGKHEDIVSIIKKIKDLKEKEVVFQLEKGSMLLQSSANLKLMKRTGETMGKKILVTTTDEIGRLLAIKAGVLADQTPEDLKKISPKISRQHPPKVLGDLRVRRTKPQPMTERPEPGLTSAIASKYLPQNLSSIRKPRVGRVSVIVASVLVAVIVIGVMGLVVLPKANITVYARSEPITRDGDIRVDKNATAVDPGSMVIPGQLLSKEVSQTTNFQVTGTTLSGTKSAGKVVIYNGTSNTLKLRAATTTLIVNGKKYSFTQDINSIQPSTPQSNPNPAVDIVAQEAGEGSNLPANTRLEIQNTALGNQPQVYATTSTEVTGGSATATLTLTQADLDAALAKSTEQLIATAEQELNQESPGWRLIPTGVNREVLAQTANKNVGDAVDNFDFTVIARLTGLAYREDDVKNLITGQINAVLSEDKYLVDGAKTKIDAQYKNLDLTQGMGGLSIHFETLVAYKIDSNNLARLLSGKNASEIREILLSKPEIDKVDVKFSPFFVRSAPRYSSKININTVLSQM